MDIGHQNFMEGMLMITPEQGAQTTMFAISSEQVGNGDYWHNVLGT